MTSAEVTEAYRANALFDAHRDDPEFGYRFLADDARDAGEAMAERTAWRICSSQRWWSVFGKRSRGKSTRPGPAVHDDLVKRNFTAERPNTLWLSDISEHRTSEGKLYLYAVKDVFSGRIVGYSIDSRMKSRLAVTAVNNAVARRGSWNHYMTSLRDYLEIGHGSPFGSPGDRARREARPSLDCVVPPSK
ncbi:DDE-type integrase/transposase/recombinase [Nocardia miyunensis]|uniref:DDE-type integrase/transposase/recombinase n=1 Tax=Nocardia miyunensis TaxID=282684 RepID=UPI001C3F74AE|nr:DDE-type integrase/transposase/recombinase [Nocardia miyunensis]